MESILPFLMHRDNYVSAEFSAAEAYALAHPAVASDSSFPSAIAVRAVNAFLDKDILVVLPLLKVAYFFEEYAMNGGTFLRLLSES